MTDPSLLACYAPIGGGLMLLCQWAVALPCMLIVLGIMMTSAARCQHPKYWVALVCTAQPIPLAFVLRDMGQFSEYFDKLWLASMGTVLVGFVVLIVWPGPSNGVQAGETQEIQRDRSQEHKHPERKNGGRF